MVAPPCLIPNPAWSTEVLADIYDRLTDQFQIPPHLLPRLTDVRPRRGASLVAHIHEYGCGQYGCVFPTYDPDVVLKVTGDDTEAEFSADLSPSLVRPICVRYIMALRPEGMRDQRGSQVYLLWRQSADQVGKLGEVLGDAALDLLDAQHAAAQAAYHIIYEVYAPGKIGKLSKIERINLNHTIGVWLETCETMARQTAVPELRELGDGLVEVYRQQHIVFGDIHAGNLGLVPGDNGPHWVITDPGHVAVVHLD